MAAKNKHRLSKFIGVTYIRKAGQSGNWEELASARGTVATLDSTQQNVDVVCDTRGSVFKGTIPVGTIALTFLENASASVLAMLYGVIVNNQTAGAKTITDEAYTFSNDGVIVLNEFSNDGNGLTTPVVKSADGVTTYTISTDYTVSVSDNVTRITRASGGTITAGETVLVSGSVNVNASESTEIVSQFTVKDEFEVKVEAEVERAGVKYRRVIKLTPATLESAYAMDFLDVVRNGDINGASVTFTLSQGGKFSMYDEIITDQISG